MDRPSQSPALFGALFFILLSTPSLNELPSRVQSAYRVIYTGFVAFTEEALFRGYMLTRLQKAFNEPRVVLDIPISYALLISSALFGFWHVIHGFLAGLDIWQGFAWGTWTFCLGIFGMVQVRLTLLPDALCAEEQNGLKP